MCRGSRPKKFASAAHGIAHRNFFFEENDAVTAIPRQFVEGSGHAAARRIAHPANARASFANESLNQWKHGARVGLKFGFQVQISASQQYRDAMIADRAGEQNLVAGPHRLRRDLDAGEQTPDSGRGDVHAVGLAVLHDFGVATGNADTGFFRGVRHRANFRFQNIGGQVPLQERSVTTIASARAPDTARSFTVPLMASSPMEPPGKRSGLTTKLSVVIAILRAVDLNVRGITQRSRTRTKEKRRKQSFDESSAGLAAGAVRHFNLRFAKPDFGRPWWP